MPERKVLTEVPQYSPRGHARLSSAEIPRGAQELESHLLRGPGHLAYSQPGGRAGVMHPGKDHAIEDVRHLRTLLREFPTEETLGAIRYIHLPDNREFVGFCFPDITQTKGWVWKYTEVFPRTEEPRIPRTPDGETYIIPRQFPTDQIDIVISLVTTFSFTGTNIQFLGADPLFSIPVGAGAMWGSTTAGAAGPTQFEFVTNNVDRIFMDFDNTSAESAQFDFLMPDGWNGGTLTARFEWTNTAIPAVSAGGVRWGISGAAFADADDIDTAFGTVQSVTDNNVGVETDKVRISSSTSAITLAGSPAGGQVVHFNVLRQVAHGDDDLDADARLANVLLEYTRSAYAD